MKARIVYKIFLGFLVVIGLVSEVCCATSHQCHADHGAPKKVNPCESRGVMISPQTYSLTHIDSHFYMLSQLLSCLDQICASTLIIYIHCATKVLIATHKPACESPCV